MPELPEVEVVRCGLVEHLTTKKIKAVGVLHPRPLRNHPAGAEGFATEVTGREISAVRRRGKYLWFALEDQDALLVHLGMSGQFRLNDPGDPVHKHTRVTFDLDSKTQLRFLDQRMFGGLSLVPGGAELPVPHIARDPFDPAFEAAEAAMRLRRKRSTLKRALLDQRLVSGIGNIYADEALWLTRLHYDYPSGDLSQQKATELFEAATKVMSAALAQGGTSFDSLYVNVNGESGYFSRELNAYGREDQPCKRCGTAIRREHFMNRSSFRCPRCQPASKVGSHDRL